MPIFNTFAFNYITFIYLFQRNNKKDCRYKSTVLIGWDGRNRTFTGRVKVCCPATRLHPSILRKRAHGKFRMPFSLGLGWKMGLEPTVSSATNWRFNRLSYIHHMARLKGLEPLTLCLEGRCSIQLSYRRKLAAYKMQVGAGDGNRTHATSLEGWSSTIELHPRATRTLNTAWSMIP